MMILIQNNKDEVLKACQELVLATDIILIDWMLGLRDSPEHCINILKEVTQLEGNRFIVILSEADDVITKFREKFDDFKEEKNGWLYNDKGSFVTIQKKENFGKLGNGTSSTTLLDKIFSLMEGVYKDYLHWIALEIAAKIKEATPKWISSLPDGTDLGMLAEHIHSTELVKDTVFENLMDDLHFSLNSDHISCLDDAYLDVDKWLGKDEFIHEIEQMYSGIEDTSDRDTLKSRIKQLIPCCIQEQAPSNIGAKVKALKKLRDLSDTYDIPPIKRFLVESDKFAEFCETVSIPLQHNCSIKRGSIFIDSSNSDMQSMWVCISQACDCVRSENLMFLEGKKVDRADDQGVKLYTRFQQSLFEFSCEPRILKIENIEGESRQIANKKCVGYLRRDIVDRLAGRYWAHITRVGVNIPILERNLRPKD